MNNTALFLPIFGLVFSSKGHSLVSGSPATSSNSKSADKAQPKRFNPWADPNFFPGARETMASMPATTEAKPISSKSQPHGPKTPWSDPSFMPKAMETAPLPHSPEPSKKPADMVVEDDLAKAIAMSLDNGQSASAPEAQNDPSLTSKINQELLSELLDMGFPRIRAEKALILSNAKTMEAATNWLIEHEQDADIDEPLTVVGATPKADEMFDDSDDGLSDGM
ncbi:hypothetical protein BVRB_026650 [Beta vulgaris subsp. vulgaris]|uniref:UBA domain-containing protein n=1 Tax=Beta vulgaris subsp. vulgaris TaxID=3555 RepID=A0A0J8AYN6_BETVV|nr:hypothetical protein BVRB_026650 [Beta vulgaris subsp. vulgaris]